MPGSLVWPPGCTKSVPVEAFKGLEARLVVRRNAGFGLTRGSLHHPASQLQTEDGKWAACIFRILGPRRSAFGPALPAAEAQGAFHQLRLYSTHMPATREHHYRLTTRWTGNLGRGTAAYTAYSRNHEFTGVEKSGPIFGSSDPAFRGDPARYNPEELLLGALAACHMLWVLHLCADAGIVITEYEDATVGEMIEREDGSGHFTRVVLRPRMSIMDAARIADAVAIHEKSHHLCALAQSVNFPVACEPEVTTAARS